MRDQLDHLPQGTKRELAHVVRVLFEEFDAALRSGTTKWSKQARIFKIVLYGSYARGDWVSDPIGGYESDYDIMIVVNDERLAEFDFWSAADDRLVREFTITRTLSTPVNFIAHSLTDVNAQLERGLPFFVDIVGQGIALYEAEGFPFAAPSKLPAEVARAEAQKHFSHWFALASQSVQTFALQRTAGNSDTWRNDAAFTLHQATERIYHCTLLVLTLYSPKSHRLNFLRSHCEQIVPALADAWPRSARFERRCFELLRQAYVNARYSPHYEITDEELAWLGERVSILLSLVDSVCRSHLNNNGSEAGQGT